MSSTGTSDARFAPLGGRVPPGDVGGVAGAAWNGHGNGDADAGTVILARTVAGDAAPGAGPGASRFWPTGGGGSGRRVSDLARGASASGSSVSIGGSPAASLAGTSVPGSGSGLAG